MNTKKLIILSLIIFFSLPLQGLIANETESSKKLPTEQTLDTILNLDEDPIPFSQDQIYKDLSYLIVYLLVFIALIYIATLMLRKILYSKQKSSINSSADFYIEESLSLSPTATLHIVHIKDRKVLIGETAHTVTTLSDI